MDKNQEISIQTQQKFEFYFLALVFTVLGLSIQTSVFTSEKQAAIEIIAWVSFLISGLAGLSRMEWIPVSYQGHSDLMLEKSHAQDSKKGRPFVDKSGKSLSSAEIADYGQKVEIQIKKRTEILYKIEAWSKVKYFLHKWMFVIGLVLLVLSRAINLCS
jgi:hypothetical protein